MVLTPRRKHLLASADVVVYVCDSSAAFMARALEGLDVFHQVMRGRTDPAPLVIQANKQDQADALDGSTIAERLGQPGAPVVEAIAEGGMGVMDTFVAAVRSVARMIEGRFSAESVTPSLFETVDQIGLAGDTAPFIDALERGMAQKLTGDELRKLSLWSRSNATLDAARATSGKAQEGAQPRSSASRESLSRALSRITGAL